MPCQYISNGTLAGSRFEGGFLCGGQPGDEEDEMPVLLCSWCGKQEGLLLCDYSLPDDDETCDAPLCEACAEHIEPDLDICPKHDMSDQVQQCEHLEVGSFGYRRHVAGIVMDLCADCEREMKARLDEESRPLTPIEQYAVWKETGMQTCEGVFYRFANTARNYRSSCGLVADPGRKQCPRCAMLQPIEDAKYEAAEQDRIRIQKAKNEDNRRIAAGR